jgi:predicted RNA binding protein YcfA (HicA-like mRNA interferase family)
MGRLSGFGYSEIISRLKSFGFILDRHAKGSHEIWYNPNTHRRTVVPHHSGDMPEGTLRGILKRSEIDVDEFLRMR